jgi:hypothetical protein
MMLTLEHVVIGCAFLKYDTKEQAMCAIEALNGVYRMEVCWLHPLTHGCLVNGNVVMRLSMELGDSHL